jgi:hypothetical protein
MIISMMDGGNEMKNVMKFIAKAFFGGCIGCLGAWVLTASLILILILILNATIGPGLVDSAKGFFQDLPNTLFSSLSSSFIPESENIDRAGTNPAAIDLSYLQCPPGSPPGMDLFVTAGNDPTAKHISQFAASESSTVRFWVKAPQDVTVNFVLVLTSPNGAVNVFGDEDDPVFTSDPGGLPYSVGSFGWGAAIGSYDLTLYVCQDVSVTSLSFEVTP